MPKVYDDWDRLVRATVRRQEIWELCHAHSRTTSGGSTSLGGTGTPGSISPIDGAGSAPAIRRGVGNFENQAYWKRNGEEERNWGENDEIESEEEEPLGNLVPCLPAITLAYYKRKKPYDHFFDIPAEEVPEAQIGQLKRFSLRELLVATDHFSNKCFLGRGDFGKVYKGRLADGSLVAVKRMKKLTQDKEVQFLREVETIKMTAHRNLLSLRGVCVTPTERILAYPYMANGSVELWLREPRERPLNWHTRKRVALGSAKGLVYLHDHCNPQIIHRDVKAANILLDYDMEAVVGDFGLAILMDTHVTSVVCGTDGHIAPEYLSTGKVSEKIDVYGYGVMLLELITGLRALELARLANDDGVVLVDWVNGLLKEKRLETLVDVDLGGNYIDEEVEQLIQVALLCTLDSPEERPKMSEVVQMLEGDGPLLRWEGRQRKEMYRKEFNLEHHPVPTTDWIIDSISSIRAEELSGPR